MSTDEGGAHAGQFAGIAVGLRAALRGRHFGVGLIVRLPAAEHCGRRHAIAGDKPLRLFATRARWLGKPGRQLPDKRQEP